MLWDIDLIFGMWVYCDKLQIEFTFRFGPMIFGRVMALGLWNLSKYLVVTTFFPLCLEILNWFLVYECIIMRWRSSLHFVPVSYGILTPMPSYGPWTLKIGQIFSCHHFFSLCLEVFSLYFNILTSYLVCGCIMISYRSCVRFVPVQWFFTELWPLDFEICPNI